MKVDDTLLLKLENLARLELSEEERNGLRIDLQRMIEMVSKLDELDLENIEPWMHMTIAENVMREDMIQEQLSVQQTLKNAPGKEEDYFKVPKMIDRK